MPGWTSPDDIGTMIQDLQSRVRRLETYNAAPLYASSVLLNSVLATSLTANTFGFSSPAWAVAYSQTFNLSATQTVLAVYQQAYRGFGGTANFVYVSQNIDSTSPASSEGVASVVAGGGGVTNATLMLRAGSLGPGTHTWYGIYTMDLGATTTYQTFAPRIDIYIIGA